MEWIGIGISILTILVTIIIFAINNDKQNKRMLTMETNHMAHMETDIDNLKKDMERSRTDISDIYEKYNEMNKTLYKIAGKIGVNGDK